LVLALFTIVNNLTIPTASKQTKLLSYHRYRHTNGKLYNKYYFFSGSAPYSRKRKNQI